MRYIELFAGIGGFRFALDQLDAQSVMTSEIDKEGQEAYLNNFGQNEPIVGDLNKIDAKDVPMHDILTGGFPC